MMPPSMYGNNFKKMRIARMLVQTTGTYNQQFARPYQSNLDQQAKNTIMDQIERSKAIIPSAIAGIANQFVAPVAQPESTIDIVGGWAEKRLRFVLQIETTDITGMNVTTEFVTGYTDHPGVSMQSQYLDPNMVFYINGITMTRTTNVSTPLGDQKHHNLADSSHVLINNQYRSFLEIGPSSKQMFGMRPEDVFDQIDQMALSEGLVNEDFSYETRNLITSNAVKSNRVNSVAPVYVAGILDSWLQANRFEREQGASRITETARRQVASEPSIADPFMTFLRNRNSQVASNSFTLNDLMLIDPNAMQVTKFVSSGELDKAHTHSAGQTQHWGGSDYATLIAATVSNSVPSYLIQCGLSNIGFIANNLGFNGVTDIKIVAAPKSLSNSMDLTLPIQKFIFRLENEMLRSLSYSNSISYMLEVKCDTLGETWINISVNGEPTVLYVTPSFCDALMTPVTTYNNALLNSVASDFNTLMGEIAENVDNKYTVGLNTMQTGMI
jgi:hypothetical protein